MKIEGVVTAMISECPFKYRRDLDTFQSRLRAARSLNMNCKKTLMFTFSIKQIVSGHTSWVQTCLGQPVFTFPSNIAQIHFHQIVSSHSSKSLALPAWYALSDINTMSCVPINPHLSSMTLEIVFMLWVFKTLGSN